MTDLIGEMPGFQRRSRRRDARPREHPTADATKPRSDVSDAIRDELPRLPEDHENPILICVR